MKAKSLLSIVFFFVLLSATQTKAKIIILGSAGMSIPNAPDEFTELFDTGLNVGSGFGYYFDGRRRIALHWTVGYSSMPFDDGGALVGLTGVSIGAPSLEIWEVSLGPRLNLAASDSRIIPFLQAGLGFYRKSFVGELSIKGLGQSFSLPFNETEIELGFHLGAGIQLNLINRAGFFAEVRYNLVKGEGDNTGYMPFTIGFFQMIGTY